ncbi:MAG: hypothetical protein U0183_32610 [Polyangiaceae bacterium]
MRRDVGVAAAMLALVACSPLADVVAYANGTGEPPSDPSPPTATPSPGPSPTVPGAVPIVCQTSKPWLALRTLDGRIALVSDPGTPARPISLSPECTFPGGGPIAPNASGTMWATYGGKVYDVDPSGACKALPLALDATAMAFVLDPRSGGELLYAIVSGVLVVIDPVSMARTPIGKAAVPEPLGGLVGTIDGRLFAVTGRTKPVLYELHLGDATASGGTSLAVAQAIDEAVRGMGALPAGPAIVTESAVLWTDPKLSSTDRVPHGLTSVVAAGASPCASIAL